MSTLYLCGAGNPEGVRLAQIINQQQKRWDRLVLLDDDPARQGQKILDVEILGPFGLLEQADQDRDEVANLVARNAVKRRAAGQRIEQYGLRPATLIAPGVDQTGAEFGDGVIVYYTALVGPEARLQTGSVVFMGAIAGHGSQLGRGCIVASNAVLNGRVLLGEGVYVGTSATVLPDVKVGSWATIGAGSVVTRDVPAGATVLGVPAAIVLTCALKLRMGAFDALPSLARRQLEGAAGPSAQALASPAR